MEPSKEVPNMTTAPASCAPFRISREFMFLDQKFVISKPSKYQVDQWDRKWHLIRNTRKGVEYRLERESLIRGLPDGSMQQNPADCPLLTRIRDLDTKIEALEAELMNDVEIWDRTVTRELGAKADLMAIAITFPQCPPERWLDEDTTLFNVLWDDIQEHVFMYGEIKEETLFESLVMELSLRDPADTISIKEFSEMLSNKYNELLESNKKKSSHVYNVKDRTVPRAVQ